MNKNELQAMIELLDDTDKEIYALVSKSIFEKGVDVVPDLEKAWEMSTNTVIQDKLEDIIHQIQLNFIQQSLLNWIKYGATDVLEGAYIVARYQYPELNIYEIFNAVKKLVNQASDEINEDLTAVEKVNVLNKIIFDNNKFSSNTSNYYSPQNSYINQVIYSKKGNPISLGIIYIAVAYRLGIPIYGVNLPKNFILGYRDMFYNLLNSNADDSNILFYINPFNRGTILGRKEIDNFLKQQNIKMNEMFYETCSNLEIIQRLILNLIYSYEKLGYSSKVKDLQGLLKLSKSSFDHSDI